LAGELFLRGLLHGIEFHVDNGPLKTRKSTKKGWSAFRVLS
jgi:hypothetical protein